MTTYNSTYDLILRRYTKNRAKSNTVAEEFGWFVVDAAHQGFERLPNTGGPQKYRCVVCDNARPCLKGSFNKHRTSVGHQDKLKQLNFLSEVAQRNRQDNLNHSYNRRAASEVADDNSSVGQNAESDSEDEGEHVGMDPADWGYPLHFDHDEEDREEEEDEGPGMHFWDWHWGNETSENNEEPPTLDHNQSNTQPGPQRSRRIPANAPWYPFPTKEYMIASLILGYLHNVMSCTMYNHLRLILTLCVVNLPHWDTIRRFRAKLREMKKVDVIENQTVLSNRTFSLSVKNIIANELANPLVVNHMEFVPHDPQGHNIHSLYQSTKWREDLPRNLRVPMVTHGGKHFYIYEPVGLVPRQGDSAIVVPIFFFKQGGKLYSKCIKPKYITPRLCLQREFDICIPDSVHFNHPDLMVIPVQEFQLIYSELVTFHGESFYEKSRGNIFAFGEGTFPEEISYPNPWRICAQNRVIHHVPITLYADDTSGNQSKRWNKHVSYCFTLSGLSPKLTNMEYNCHSIATSNQAGPLEIAEPIIAELNELATHGSIAYDAQLGQEVLFMVIPLCFLADSPKAAEITNTPNPGTSNNPCRVCHLQCPQGEEKSTLKYLQDFFGQPNMPQERHWPSTIANTKNLWICSQTETQKEFEREQQLYGIKDRITFELIARKHGRMDERLRIIQLASFSPNRLYNPFLYLLAFDGCQDTPVEILHVILLGVVKYLWKDFMGQLKPAQLHEIEARWAAFQINGLNVAPIQAKYVIAHYKSFAGKEFQVVLQATPFVLFPLMTNEQREIWTDLCYIGSYAFQTHIIDMESYIWNLTNHIRHFLYAISKMSGRWANKPKLHMLLHLPGSIRRFGPASLLATEKFESFNGIVRTHAIHFSRKSPGKDLAISFEDFQIERALFSGIRLYDHKDKRYFQASQGILDFFANNPLIQQSLGYNSDLISSSHYPCQHGHYGPQPPEDQISVRLKTKFPNSNIKKVAAIKISSKEILREGSWVLEADSAVPSGHIVYVESIWEVMPNVYYAKLDRAVKMGVQPENHMTMISKDFRSIYTPVKNLMCCLNVQHNCFSGQCTTIQSTIEATGQKEGASITHKIIHKDDNSFY
ncbi:hypothetical protein KEM48_009166 [Puccinia striiformis f. sp. tritici PST-130]|nr:hypothetical protein KEM48_009166 [Puccinia striiformis f. sp. tritici PST-130]